MIAWDPRISVGDSVAVDMKAHIGESQFFYLMRLVP